MKKVDDVDLSKIYGGTSSLSGTVINAFTNIIKVLYDAGHSVGAALRRIGEGNLCPLE